MTVHIEIPAKLLFHQAWIPMPRLLAKAQHGCLPSTLYTLPVTKEARSETRKMITFATSSGVPSRVLATCGILWPELACENPSCCLLLLADSSEEEYNLKH
jgi:hypothetical protein